MMIPERPSLERRVLAALDGIGRRRPAHSGRARRLRHGRTSLLLRLRDLHRPQRRAQYIDVERIATTPERFFQAMRDVVAVSRARYGHDRRRRSRARASVRRDARFLDTARAPGDAPATFLLDEFLELRTFESFPGLRRVLRDLIARARRRAATASC